MLYQPPLPPMRPLRADTPLLGCLRSGDALRSSPQQRRILILIVALQRPSVPAVTSLCRQTDRLHAQALGPIFPLHR
jgi:hypothetical protein